MFSTSPSPPPALGSSPPPSSSASLFGALQPKSETQADSFLRNFPLFDGRGVVVAIADTGVDPGAAGLQFCPDGRPKIVDMVECSGSGDVDTRTVVRAFSSPADGGPCVLGLSGRTLRLNPSWTNPSGLYRVGLKRAFELYPGPLVDRVRAERAEAAGERHADLVVAAQR